MQIACVSVLKYHLICDKPLEYCYWQLIVIIFGCLLTSLCPGSRIRTLFGSFVFYFLTFTEVYPIECSLSLSLYVQAKRHRHFYASFYLCIFVMVTTLMPTDDAVYVCRIPQHPPMLPVLTFRLSLMVALIHCILLSLTRQKTWHYWYGII